MKKIKEGKTKTKLQTFVMQISTSKYSKHYADYMKNEFSNIEILLKKFIKMPFCRDYYLKYPLQGLMRGICKKLLVNTYEFTVYAYFLSQVEWKLQHHIYSNLAQVFPNIIHVNEPTDPQKLKQISMFLYFSCYSVKQFLNEDIQLLKQEMTKIFPQFQHLQTHWTASQQTVGHAINPKLLNSFFKELSQAETIVDYNTSVDKILQISPCYDIASRNQKHKQTLHFGFMQARSDIYNYSFQGNQNIKIEDNLDDYQFDGEI